MWKVVVLLSCFLGFALQGLHAQPIKPPVWSVEASPVEVKPGGDAELIFRARIPASWYIYSSDVDPNLGPQPTSFKFKKNAGYKLLGGIRPIGAKKKYSDIWEGEYTYFSGTAEFRQKVKILSADVKIEGTYEYQMCSDASGQCVPFDDEFKFGSDVLKIKKDETADTVKKDSLGTVDTLGNAAAVDTSGAATADAASDSVASSDSSKTGASIHVGNFLKEEAKKNDSLWLFLLFSFGAGLLALLTPCVYPMIPMTVTFFTGRSGSKGKAIRSAFIFGLSIVLIYVVLGTVIAWINGPDFANWLSTHWIPNLLFFLIFIVFALAFLGMFELTLPSKFVNKADAKAEKGGLTGIFFMAFTLALVSFSCTGPIVGSILVESAGGIALKPIVGMVGYSLAFAVPFMLFAAFPSWLSNLPKSGGWLNVVKVVLGFLELALSLKFLSLADQAYHWRILDREVFLALWIAIFLLMGLYLLGIFRLPHDSETRHIGVPRAILAVITFAFVIYLVPGMFGAPLRALAGILPPSTTQDFDLTSLREGVGTGAAQSTLCDTPKHSDFLKLPHNLQGYFDYKQGMVCAKKLDKPVFIDFTGHGCVNCREMEANVWSDPEVLKRLRNDYVIIALYVDDKTELPESEWYVSDYDGKQKKTIGKQNADLQIKYLNNNAQPYYVLLNTNGDLLVKPKAYDLSVDRFVKFLDEGLAEFQKEKK